MWCAVLFSQAQKQTWVEKFIKFVKFDTKLRYKIYYICLSEMNLVRHFSNKAQSL